MVILKDLMGRNKQHTFNKKIYSCKKIIKKGDIFNIKNITTKEQKKVLRSKWNLIIGKKSNYDFEIDENIRI